MKSHMQKWFILRLITQYGQVHRNCSHNRVRSENTPDDSNGPNNLPDLPNTSRIIANRSHKGTAIRPSDCLSQSAWEGWQPL